jgi:hypothetical protein
MDSMDEQVCKFVLEVCFFSQENGQYLKLAIELEPNPGVVRCRVCHLARRISGSVINVNYPRTSEVYSLRLLLNENIT